MGSNNLATIPVRTAQKDYPTKIYWTFLEAYIHSYCRSREAAGLFSDVHVSTSLLRSQKPINDLESGFKGRRAC